MQLRRGGVPSFLALLLLVALSTPAAAHLSLVSSEPSEGVQLAEVPREIRLRFSEPAELAFTQVELLGPAGTPIRLSEPRIAAGEPNVVVLRIEDEIAPGPHSVVWRTTSADGHPVRGRIAFSVAEDAEGLAAYAPEEPAAVSPVHHDPAVFPDADGFSAESPGYVAVRWLTFVGLLGVIGIVAFRLLVLGLVRRRGDAEGLLLLEPAAARAAGVGLAFALLLLLAVLARLYAQSLALHGPGEALSRTSLSAMLTRTTWGLGWMLQAAAASVVLAGFLAAWRRARTATHAGWALAAAGVVALAFTPALAGHAVAVPGNPALAILSDGLHVLGAGGWLGSLLAVVLVGIPAALQLDAEARGAAVAALVNAFSPTALFFAALVTVTGVVSATFHLGSVADLWRSDYGRVLLLKVGVLALVFGTGAYNWLRVRPALGDARGASRLRRSAGAELAVGAAVLLITAVLVATPPPMDAERPADGTDVEASP
jgi:putative copper export protein/methionine-rich copper-binding protein CopC